MSAVLNNDVRSLGASGAPRSAQVLDQLSQLETVIQEGQKIQDEFEQRLASILNNGPQIAEGGSKIQEVSLAPLAERVMSLMMSVRGLNSRYASLMRRLEV